MDCDLGVLAPGDSVIVTILVQASQTGTIVDSATASAAEPDADPSNDTAVVGTGVEALPPMVINISETFHVSDSNVKVIPPAVISIDETFHVSDTNVKVVPPAVISIGETFHVSDTDVKVIPPAVINLGETFHLSDAPSVQLDPDSDGDGIKDLVDLLPLVPMICALSPPYDCVDGGFSDVAQGGVTTGVVLTRPPDAAIEIVDVVDGGIHVATTGGASIKLVPLEPEEETGAVFIVVNPALFKLTVGSALLEVEEGTVHVDLPALGAIATTDAGDTLLLEAAALTDVTLTAVAGSPVIDITSDNSVVTIAMGTGSSLNISQESPDSPLALTALAGVVTVTIDGQEVTLEAGDVLVLADTPRDRLEDSLAALQSLDSHSNRIKKAIQHLQRALHPTLWLDDSLLRAQGGQRVFNNLQQAVQQLEKLKVGAKKHQVDQATYDPAQAVIPDLVDAARELAMTSIEEAQSAGPSNNPRKDAQAQRHVQDALQDLSRGDTARAKGDAAKAIQDYRKAWQHAQVAFKILDGMPNRRGDEEDDDEDDDEEDEDDD